MLGNILKLENKRLKYLTYTAVMALFIQHVLLFYKCYYNKKFQGGKH